MLLGDGVERKSDLLVVEGPQWLQQALLAFAIMPWGQAF